MHIYKDWILTGQRVAFHVPTATAVVADLHLGYDDCRRKAGDAIPFFDLEKQLQPLGKALKKQDVYRLVIAGDLFEAGYAPLVACGFQRWLAAAGVVVAALVPGNHDRGVSGVDHAWPLFPEGFMVGSWRVLHGDENMPEGPVVHGHVHPAIVHQGRKLPCFLVGPDRIVLPAYSPDAAGVNVDNDRAWHGYGCLAIRADGILDMGELGVFRRKRLQRTI